MGQPLTPIVLRLRKWGVWDEARQYRDKALQDYIDEGLPWQDAYELAWERIDAMFPPNFDPTTLAPAEEPQDTEPPGPTEEETAAEREQVELEELAAKTKDAADDPVRDINWVSRNLERKFVTPAECPSLSAWSMFKWAKDNPDKFFTQTLSKAIPKLNSEDAPSGDEEDADDDMSIDEIKGLIFKK